MAAKTVPRGLLGGLGLSWEALGPSWGGLGPLLGALGPSLDGLGVFPGRSWGLLDPLGTVLAAILGPTNHKIEIQTAQGQSPQTFGVDFGSQNGSQNDPKTTPKRVKNQDEKCITFLSLLDPSWTGLEAILALSWGQK